MNQRERDAIGSICLLAAEADGTTDARERARIGDIARMLGSRADGITGTIAAEAGALATPELRTLAYEMAVAVCNADGASSAKEREFLAALASALDLRAKGAGAIVAEADALAAQPLDTPTPALASIMAATTPVPFTPAPNAPKDAELDAMILNYAILTGALELLPQSLATLAIIPLQSKMVYRIAKKHAVSLDRRSIAEFAATLGIGATSQVIESFARRMVGGTLGSLAPRLLGSALGGTAAGLGARATGAAFGFATTYALGHAARQYYAGGRKLSGVDLRTLFSSHADGARELYQKYAPQIEAQARSINPLKLLSLVGSG